MPPPPDNTPPAPAPAPAPPPASPPVSVVIVCANSQATLPQALHSARWADELLVVDSGSQDQTAEIAKRDAHRYVLEPWRGHTEQKKFAADLAKHDWVLFLDGDEEISPELADELQNITPGQFERYDLFLIPRKNYVMGRHIRAWGPDHLTRLFHRKRCTWGNQVLHDTRSPSHPSRQRKLKNHLLHKQYSDAGFDDYFSGKRMDDRLMDSAKQMYNEGKRCSYVDLAMRPLLAFLKFYFIKRGLLDGSFGLMIAQKAYVSTQLRYAALWAVQQEGDEAG